MALFDGEVDFVTKHVTLITLFGLLFSLIILLITLALTCLGCCGKQKHIGHKKTQSALKRFEGIEKRSDENNQDPNSVDADAGDVHQGHQNRRRHHQQKHAEQQNGKKVGQHEKQTTNVASKTKSEPSTSGGQRSPEYLSMPEKLTSLEFAEQCYFKPKPPTVAEPASPVLHAKTISKEPSSPPAKPILVQTQPIHPPTDPHQSWPVVHATSHVPPQSPRSGHLSHPVLVNPAKIVQDAKQAEANAKQRSTESFGYSIYSEKSIRDVLQPPAPVASSQKGSSVKHKKTMDGNKKELKISMKQAKIVSKSNSNLIKNH